MSAAAPSPGLSERRRLVTEGWLVAAAFAFGAVSLTFPLGRDQALFAFTAKRWFFEGALPYRDVFEQKTPFIYLLHGTLYVLFGTHQQWGIRLAELLAMPALGWAAAQAGTPRGSPLRPGAFGAATFASSFLYYGFFTWMETANCEMWVSLFALASLGAARRLPGLGRAAVVSGAFAGLAMVAKPPGVLFGLFSVAFLVQRARAAGGLRAVAAPLGLFGAGAAVLPGLVLAYFGWKGALNDLLDVVFLANAHIAREERVYVGLFGLYLQTLSAVHWFAPLSTLFAAITLGSAAHAFLRGERERATRWALPVGLVALAYGIVWLQTRFFLYHYGLLLVGLPVFVVVAVERLEALVPQGPDARAGLLVGALLLAFATSGMPKDQYLLRMQNWRDHLLGRTDAETFAASFTMPNYLDVGRTRALARWLREHTAPGDEVLVRGHEPMIYVLADRTTRSRFFWTPWLTMKGRAYRRAEWVAEDAAQMDARSARYVVAFDPPGDFLDSMAFAESRGYAEVERMGAFVILERR